jgi:dienelactone hydrolase
MESTTRCKSCLALIGVCICLLFGIASCDGSRSTTQLVNVASGPVSSGGKGGPVGDSVQMLNELKCYVYVPTSYSDEIPTPYMQVYHGGSSHADGDILTKYKETAELKGFILCSVSLVKDPWEIDIELANGVRDEMVVRYNIDLRHCYIGGHSWGGGIALNVGILKPGWAGIHVLSGNGWPPEKLPRPSKPVVAIYWTAGENDGILNYEKIQKDVKRLRRKGYNVNFVPIESGDWDSHALSWSDTGAAWDWTYSQ